MFVWKTVVTRVDVVCAVTMTEDVLVTSVLWVTYLVTVGAAPGLACRGRGAAFLGRCKSVLPVGALWPSSRVSSRPGSTRPSSHSLSCKTGLAAVLFASAVAVTQMTFVCVAALETVTSTVNTAVDLSIRAMRMVARCVAIRVTV